MTAVQMNLVRAQQELERAQAALQCSKQAEAKLASSQHFKRRACESLELLADEKEACELKLQLAQQEVDRAQAKIQRAENAKLKLAEKRQQLRQLEPELQKLADEGLQLKADEETAEKNVTIIAFALQKLDDRLVNDLPDGDELVTWQRLKAELEQQLAGVVAVKTKVRDRLAILRSRVMEIEPQVTRGRFAVQQYLQLAKGDDPDDQTSWIGSGGSTLFGNRTPGFTG